ncbi:MAG: isochorismatase family cysteine hydrolase [Chloroflexota bacterium]
MKPNAYDPARIDPGQAVLIAYDVCKRALTPADPARRAQIRPVLDAWVTLIGACRAAKIPVLYTTPVTRPDESDAVFLATDLSVETGTPSLTNSVEGTADAEFPDEIAPTKDDYVFLKRRPSAFYGTGAAEVIRMLRRNTVIIGGGATNRGVETSVREGFSMDLRMVVVREACWGGDQEAHEYSLNKSMKMYAQIRTLEQTMAMLKG